MTAVLEKPTEQVTYPVAELAINDQLERIARMLGGAVMDEIETPIRVTEPLTVDDLTFGKIDASQLVRVYQQLGAVPIRHGFTAGSSRLCGVMAVATFILGTVPINDRQLRDALERKGISWSYVEQFVWGFDDRPGFTMLSRHQMQERSPAYRDGARAWSAVRHMSHEPTHRSFNMF